jgi:hypothetical protein
MFCPDCMENLDDVPSDSTCPRCGGFSRSAIARPQAAEVHASVGEVGLGITKGDHPSWTEKWRTVLHCLDELREAYSGDARQLGHLVIDNRVSTFFVECDHLRDWLKKDARALGSATQMDVDRHYELSQPLQRCNAVCNSHKHHTRRSGITARIRDTSITSTGARVTIEVDWRTADAIKVDALDLAEECVACWRSFFEAFDIPEVG